MIRGVIGSATRLYYWFVLFRFSLFFYWVVFGLYAANMLSIRLANQEADRLRTWIYWRFAISCIVAIFPPVFFHELLYNNMVHRWYQWVLAGSIVCGGFIGLHIVLMAIDWTNCENVSYCTDVDFPPTFDGPDYSFYWAFFSCVWFMTWIVLWLWASFWLRNRIEYRNVLDYWSNPNRQGVYMGGDSIDDYGANVYVRAQIGAPLAEGQEDSGARPRNGGEWWDKHGNGYDDQSHQQRVACARGTWTATEGKTQYHPLESQRKMLREKGYPDHYDPWIYGAPEDEGRAQEPRPAGRRGGGGDHGRQYNLLRDTLAMQSEYAGHK